MRSKIMAGFVGAVLALTMWAVLAAVGDNGNIITSYQGKYKDSGESLAGLTAEVASKADSDTLGNYATTASMAEYRIRSRVFYDTDWLSTVVDGEPWGGWATNSGTRSLVAAAIDSNHPGVIYFKSSSSNNSGWRIATNYASIVLGGGEESTFVFQVVDVTDAITARFGFHDCGVAYCADGNDMTNGAYLEAVTDGSSILIYGKTAAASTRSTTATDYELTEDTWYNGQIVVAQGGATVDYYIYNAAGTQLWTDSLTTNIPTAAVRHGVIALESTGTTIEMLYLDYMNVYIKRDLTR